MLKSLRAKLILLSLVPAIVPLILVFLLIRHQQADAVQAAADECRRINVVSLDEIAHGLYTACETQQEVLQSMVDSGLRLTNDVIGRLGGASLDAAEAVSWTAVNQYTQETRAVSLPKLLVGSTWLGQNSDTQIPSPVVDEVRDIVGGTATVFQRMNREGDMLRVCTNVAGTDGTRAIGTFVPATNPDGTPNPVVAAVLAGQTFHGRAYVVDRWYITAYEPIFDANREVIGVSYFGVPMESTQALRQAVMDVQIAETGYVYVLDTQGHYVISKDGKRDGENIWDAKDSDGVHFIQEIVAKARAGEEHEIFSQYYPWKNEGEAPRMKVARCIYYEPWDWIIGASSYIDEFEAAPRQIKADGHRNLLVLLVVMIATSFVATLLGVVASRRIVAPVLRAVGVADRIAQGDLSEKLDLQGEDEVARLGGALDRMVDGLRSKAGMAEVIANGDLTVEPEVISERDLFGRALRQMTDSLNEILRGVMETANTVATGSREIRSASADSARSATEQAASLEEMSSATTELSQQVELNAVSARRADEVSRNALSAAEVGAERMGALNVAMAEISTSSQQMAQIIEAIDEIAEQTNLLALNAAIEAARAGEHGRSFAVVADEVRNLAARSASAAQETTGLIRGSLDRIARGIDIAEETSTALRTISDGVREASGLVAQIAAASQEQAAAITEVSANLIQIDQMTGRSSAATEEAASSAGELSKQAETLERLLGRFRLRA